MFAGIGKPIDGDDMFEVVYFEQEEEFLRGVGESGGGCYPNVFAWFWTMFLFEEGLDETDEHSTRVVAVHHVLINPWIILLETYAAVDKGKYLPEQGDFLPLTRHCHITMGDLNPTPVGVADQQRRHSEDLHLWS